MGKIIRHEDIETLKSRLNIVEVVGQQVTLKRAGINSFKGLCPFHDEKTPSFTVNESLGVFHCFGCQESGDTISFIQKIHHYTFIEAVEYLAESVNFPLTYEESDRGEFKKTNTSLKPRLFAMHTAAQEFYRNLLESDEAARAREFLLGRNFDESVADIFGIGYSPKAWDALTKHLFSKGFTSEEMIAGGLASRSNNGGLYDRFRGRLMWPIRDVTGQTIGFGARKLDEDDKGPKYLNTSETPIYNKRSVLYGIDLAKKSIAKTKRAVIVEGYTDVMACQLAGIEQAVATCGTAFSEEHATNLRRITRDESDTKIVFTFDGDEAGKNAAMKAYPLVDQIFDATSYLVVLPNGMDPCELRIAQGDEALQRAFEKEMKLGEFVLREKLGKFVRGGSLKHGTQREEAMKEGLPLLAQIRDRNTRSEYARELARLTGVDITAAIRAVEIERRKIVDAEARAKAAKLRQTVSERAKLQEAPHAVETKEHHLISCADLFGEKSDHARTKAECDLLIALLYCYQYLDEENLTDLFGVEFTHEPLDKIGKAIFEVLKTAPNGYKNLDSRMFIDHVQKRVPKELLNLLNELGTGILAVQDNEPDSLRRYVNSLVCSFCAQETLLLKKEMQTRLYWAISDQNEELENILNKKILEIENYRRELIDRQNKFLIGK